MPYNINRGTLKFKDQNTGEYKSVDIIGEHVTHDSQAFAKGTRDGVPITSDLDPAYNKYAKYWAEQASDAATAAAAAAEHFNITVANHGLTLSLT